MKNLLYILCFLLGVSAYSQSDGLTYQAVILDPNPQELPGVNATRNILPNTEVTMRFIILDDNGNVEYGETQQTRTDAHGIINLVIGEGQSISGSAFTRMFWDGTPKSLEVAINFGGNFNNLGTQELTFVPYAFHREIIATGMLSVVGDVLFNSDLVVDGTTNLNRDLDVNNESPARLNGSMEVEGITNLNNALNVTNQSETYLSGTLDVAGAARLNNQLNVLETTQLNSTLTVNGGTQLDSSLSVIDAAHLHNRLTVDGTTQLNNTLGVEDGTRLNNSLDVLGSTTLANRLRVAEQNPTLLTGTLTVDGQTDFNNNVSINNGSDLSVSGEMIIGGATIFENDLTVNGDTNLNNSLTVNNGSPTQLSGLLEVGGQTRLAATLLTIGSANLGSFTRVNNGSNTYLSGTLDVGLATNLNARLQVNNGASTYLSGPLNVNGLIDFGNDLTVNGITNFNDELNVLNGAPVHLSGNLNVDQDANVNGKLNVTKETILNNDLTVTNGLETNFTGPLSVDNATQLNNSLIVTNQQPSRLSGMLTVNGETLLNSNLDITQSSTTQLTGSLNVAEPTRLNEDVFVTNSSTTSLSGLLRVGEESNLNQLTVTNAAETSLTGTLDVEGETNLNNALNVQLQAVVNNDLTVTGSASLASLTSEGIAVTSDNPNAIAVFHNTNTQDGDGIQIKLGRNHGAWDGSTIVQVPNPIVDQIGTNGTTYNAGVEFLRGQLQNPGSITFNEALGMAPVAIEQVAKNSFLNQTFIGVNDYMNLPVPFPDLNMPGQLLSNEIEFYGGNSAQCSGQYCFSICFPFAGCVRVCIPPVNICVPAIPRIAFPGIDVPTIPLPNVPNPTDYFPALPVDFPTGNVPQVNVPNVPNLFADNLSKENEYIKFTDKDDRKTGVIRANSTTDFINSTALDNLYVLNVLSNFIGVDLLEGQVAGSVALLNYVDEYNKLGVEYSSGNGDYAEWLERIDASEIILPGDIVAVKGGKITKNLEDFEQLMVASHHPIIQGNVPEEGLAHLGNSVAFIGQVPVKVLGPVVSGDYIVASQDMLGYGVAISSENMTLLDHKLVVGRAWQENKKDGPKIINVVVGVQQGDFTNSAQELQDKQEEMDDKLQGLEAKLARMEQKLNTVTPNDYDYAEKE